MVQLHSSEADGHDLITLFEHADESTFIHEAAHVYLEMLRRVATAPGATEDIRRLWEDVRDALSKAGAIDDGQVSVEAHETFAASMEAYLKEGKAPSLSLVSVFRKFMSWLRAIYNAFVSMRHRPSPELAPMFDRIFASDQEMAELEEWHEARNDWASLAGSVTARRKARELREAAEGASRAALVERMAKAYLRAQGEAGDLRARAREQVKAKPVYAAIDDAMKQGGLDYETVLALMGEEYAKRIARKRPGLLRKEGGTDPSVVAAAHGYADVYAWLSEVVDSKGVQAEVEELYKAGFEKAKALVDAGMAEAEAAVPGDEEYHSEARLAALAAERQLLEERARRQESAKPMVKAMREARAEASAVMAAAKAQLDGMPVREATAARRFSSQERRAARAAWKAAKAGKWQRAEAYKRQETLFHALFMASTEARDAVAKGEKAVHAAVGQKQLSADHRDMMLELAYRFGFMEFAHGMKPAESLDAFRAMAVRDGRDYKSLDEWEAWAAGAGYPVYIPDVAKAAPVSWKELPLERFMELLTVFHQIRTVDRKERTAEIGGREIGITELVAAMEAQAARTHERDVRDRWDDGSMRARMKHCKGALHSAHAKIEAILLDMDDWEFGGVWYDAIFRPIAEAEKVQTARLRDALGKLDALKGLIFGTRSDRVSVFNDRVYIPEIRAALTMNQMLSIALNCGNAANRSRLAIGEGWTEDQIDAVLDRLEKRHWDYVQGVWDLLETFKPESFALEREMTGRSPQAVEATPVRTPWGEYRGGYYPIVYDAKLGDLAHARDQENMDRALFGGRNHGAAMTRHGHLQDRGRVGTGEHLKLDLGVVATHVYDTIHDLAYRKAVVEVAKLLRNRSVQAVMREWMGPEVSHLFMPWLQDIANEMQSMDNQEFVHRFLAWARNGATMVGMGWKVTTMAQQPLGILQTLAYIGPRWTAEGLKAFYLHPLEIGPSVLSELISGRGPDDKDPDPDAEDWAAWLARKILLYPIQAVVFGRDLANGIGESFGFKMSPAESTPASVVWLARTWAKVAAGQRDLDSGVVIKTLEQSGYVLHLPTRQAGITLGNIYDYATGRTPDFQLRDLFYPKQRDRRPR